MKTYMGEGRVLDLVVPTGGCVSGTWYIIGGILAVATGTYAEAETRPFLVEGLTQGTKASGTTAAAGAAAYFDSTSGLVEATDSATNRRCGVFSAVAANGSTVAEVRLDGVSFGAGNADLEAKADKIAPAAAHNFAGLTAAGNLEDSGHKHADYATSAQGAKADTAVQPVAGATENNFCSFDAAGKPKDSTHAHGDYAAAAHNHDSAYISIIGTPTAGNFPEITAGGELQNGTSKAADFATAAQGGKADTALQPTAGAVQDNLTSYGAAGQIEDSGIAKTAIAAKLPLAGGQMTGALLFEKGTGSDGDADDAITLNKQSGIVTTKILNAAAGAGYQLTLSNDRVVDANTPVVAGVAHGGTNTKRVVVEKVSPGAGTCVIYLLNIEPADALDGTVRISFIVG